MTKYIITCLFIFSSSIIAEEYSIQDLDFLLGRWQVFEENQEKTWWEKTTRTGKYVMDNKFIQLESVSISSTGKERVSRWYIHYNFKDKVFEMTWIFSNWYKAQIELVKWNPKKRTLTFSDKPNSNGKEYHERFGVMTFAEDFKTYVWEGVNKYGDKEKPSIFKYIETGKKLN